MRDLNIISEELFNKIRARFEKVSLGDENAKSTSLPEEARFINFDYVSRDGTNFGNITLSIIDGKALRVIYSTNITNGLGQEHQDEWTAFLRGLRKFARRNMLQIVVTDITKSNLDLRDIRQQSKANSKLTNNELNIAEGKLYGHGNNKHVSFGDVGTHKLIIKHKDQIDPDRHGARARQIEHIFVETPIGERFLLDYTNLHGARAIANHLRHGGRFGDEGSELINEMVKEMASMRHFVRSMKNRTFEDAETSGMVEAAIHRYNEVKENLKKFQGRQGHNLLMDQIAGQVQFEDEIDIDALRERFVKKIYDDRFNEALPYVYKAYKKQKEMETSEAREFMSWADSIAETSWQDDSDDMDENNLLDLAKNPILVGMDGIDAKAAIANISFLDQEDLYKQLEVLSKTQGPDADARVTIAQWLASNGEQVLSNAIMQQMQQQIASTQPAPQQPQPPKQPVGATTMDEPVVNEELSIIKWLSGLGKK